MSDITRDGDFEYTYQGRRPYIRRVGDRDWIILDGPTSNATIRSRAHIVRAYEGNFCWRRYGTTWVFQPFDSSTASSAPAESETNLYLVLQRQSDGEPKHWSLFVAPEGEAGNVYQVKGDAESMHYTHAQGIDLFKSNTYTTSYIIIRNIPAGAEDWIRHYANAEAPPSAPNRDGVTENCQGWACRVGPTWNCRAGQGY